MKKDLVFLKHIRDALAWVVDRSERGHAEFLSLEERQDTIIRKLEIAGEAAKRVSPEIREANPGIPWTNMAGMRNILVHGYDDVDLDIVWKTSVNRAPLVLGRIESLIAKLETEPD